MEYSNHHLSVTQDGERRRDREERGEGEERYKGNWIGGEID